jgi:hypothetical protein
MGGRRGGAPPRRVTLAAHCLPCSLSPAATAEALSRQGRELVGAVHRVVWWALADPSRSP